MAPSGPDSSSGSSSGSLRRRLVLVAAVAILAALLAAGGAIGFVLMRFVRGQIDQRLDTQIMTIVSALDLDPAGRPRLQRAVDGPPFDREGSGWYWQVAAADGRTALRSRSLEGDDIAAGPEPREEKRERIRPGDAAGPDGEALMTRTLGTTLGRGPRAVPVTVTASAPQAALYGPLIEAAKALALILGILAVFLVAAVFVQVRLGLAPLQRLRRSLADIRAGTERRLPTDQPLEIRPLAEELNALLGENEANLARARMHVANLAHGLKTPLATLALVVGHRTDAEGRRLSDLVDLLDRRVRHHLRRARTLATAPARLRTPLAPRVRDLCDVLVRVHADKAIAVEIAVDDGLSVACDAEDLDEMIGNLADNACKWCRGRVAVSASGGAEIAIRVEDDGSGLSDAQSRSLPSPGRRLDETVPGSGFGLAITREIAELYGGTLSLGTSPLGGVMAVLTLPAK